MKIAYCQCSLYNPGGMERVLLNKVRWICSHTDWEVVVITTDQQGRPPFYDFPEVVRFHDLGINYSVDNGEPVLKKSWRYLRKKRLHRKRLTEVLMAERPDITVSLYPSESSFIPDIKDGSKKVLELHFNRFFRLQYGRTGLMGWLDRMRSRKDTSIARRFDRFVVLTREDLGYWGDMPNIEAIPNAALVSGTAVSDCSSRRVIAVGRLDYQKSFDRLVDAWEIVSRDPRAAGWRLDIFGQGEWRDMLCAMVRAKGLEATVGINAPTNNIASEYAASSVLAMTSHYEGFPMVLIEAMASGVPAVTFDFKCGPRDIISHEADGLVVPDGDISAFAHALLSMMEDAGRRKTMGLEARKVIERYSEDSVMERWMKLFGELVADKN